MFSNYIFRIVCTVSKYLGLPFSNYVVLQIVFFSYIHSFVKWFSFRLPRLTCQSPTNQKEDSLSPHRIFSEASTCFVTEEQAKQNRGPPRRRETWNGKTVTKLCASLSLPPKIRSFSEQDATSSEQEARFSGQGARLSDDIQTHLAHQKDSFTLENDSTKAGMQQNEICKMAFPTAEDVQRGNFLSVPKLPVRRARSLNSLKSVEMLPPVFRNQDGLMVTKSSEADWTEEEVAPCPLPICSKQTNKLCQSPDGAATNKDFLQRRHRPLRRQENLLEETASVDAISIPCKSPIKSPRACSRSGTNAPRKISFRRQSSRIENGQEEEGQETALVKDVSLKKGKITARSSSLSSFCAQEDNPRMKVTKIGKQESPEARKEDFPEPLEKSKWLKALKKVLNVNMFLGGMVALQKQKERDRLALEQKQAELEKLYEELKHCRYLRLPSGEDDIEQKDTVAWVFSKE